MKAFKINAQEKKITEVEINNPILQSWYENIGNGCDMVEIAGYLDGKNVLLVDEEGLFKPQLTFGFYYRNLKLVGNGLVVGYNSRNGDNNDTTATIESIEKQIRFF